MGAQAVRLSNVDIDNALNNKDFEVLFQPIFDLGNGALARVETFVRWRHPQLGMLPPGAFISFFESQGRMSELTRYVLANALSSYLEWRGPYAPGLSVNLALSDLSDDAFASHFIKLLRDFDFPADLITLECPMPPVDMPIEIASGHFQRLTKTGARLAIEVRGRANDLLRTLDPFPFDEIKTGGSAILRFARTVRGPGLSAIADLLEVASKANAAITAVGVEDQASLSALRGLGFTAAQGNHLGKVGDLTDFRPHRINEVRSLLDLEPLSSENIAALFRTEAPNPKAAPPAIETESQTKTVEGEDALIERLNERVAQFDQSEPFNSEEFASLGAENEDEKKRVAREKAKALALAKRAKARAARKAAAIERAKSRVGQSAADDTPIPNAPPRDMQERLNQAFTGGEEAAAAPVPLPAEPEIAAPTAQSAPIVEPHGVDETPPATQNEPDQTQSPQSGGTRAGGTRAGGTRAGGTRAGGTHSGDAQAVPPESLPQLAPDKFIGGMSRPVTLSVSTASAYFQPGIRVGSPALPGSPNQPITAPGLNLARTNMAEDTSKSPTPNQQAGNSQANSSEPEPKLSMVERAVASLAPDQMPIPQAPIPQMPADEPAPASTDDIQSETSAPDHNTLDKDLIGDLHDEGSYDETAADGETPKRRKPFLQRTVVYYPTHFWPRSWRRAFRRRAIARATDNAAGEAAPDQPTVAAAE